MGKYTGGIQGTVTGRVGAHVFYKSRNQQLVRTHQPKVSVSQDDAPVSSRKGFGATAKVAPKFAAMLKRSGFPLGTGQTAYSYWNKENRRHFTVTNLIPDPTDFSLLTITKGTLFPIGGTTTGNGTAGEFKLQWSPNPISNQDNNDVVTCGLVFERPELMSSLEEDAIFSTGDLVINYPSDYSGEIAHIYAFSRKADKSNYANSEYLGSITLA